MPDTDQSSEDHAAMADSHRSQSDGRDIAVELARVAERQDAILSEVTRLANQVEKQNGRVGALEQERAARQMRSVDAARKEDSLDDRLDTILENCECRMGTMGDRVAELEAFRHDSTGARKARAGLIRDAVMIFALLVSAWQMYESRAAAHAPAPAAQHQAVK